MSGRTRLVLPVQRGGHDYVITRQFGSGVLRALGGDKEALLISEYPAWLMGSGDCMADKSAPIRIPPRGTKGQGMPPGSRVLMKVFKPLMDRQVAKLRRTTSAEPPIMMGFPVCLLTTVGSKSGEERTQVLGAFADGPDAWLIVASMGGSPKHPGWFHNIVKNPDKVWLQVGNRKLHVAVESLQGDARVKALAQVAAIAPRYGGYQKKTDREIPVLRLTPIQ
jgi:deazaflavin-dependent oxidoreductase (nitroreductase family)